MNNFLYRSRTIPLAISLGVVLVLCGWLYTRGSQNRIAAYKPTSAIAESAVMQALSAWQAGAVSREIAGTKPAIVVADVNRKPGQRLDQFKILGETPGQSGRTIAVKLELANPTENVKTEYIVVGIDPLWVFRREDFEMFIHWEHDMPAANAANGGTK